MKKDDQTNDDEMQPEYDFSEGVQGKYAARYAKGSNVVVLSPDVAAVFHDAQSVNDALRLLMKVGRRAVETIGE